MFRQILLLNLVLTLCTGRRHILNLKIQLSLDTVADSSQSDSSAGFSDSDADGSSIGKTVKESLVDIIESLSLAPEGISSKVADAVIERINKSPEMGITQSSAANNNTDQKSVLYKILRQMADQQAPASTVTESTNDDELARALQKFHSLSLPSGSLHTLPYTVKDDCIYANFTVRFPTDKEQGLYSLLLHNCPLTVAPNEATAVSATIKMVEKNVGSYLSGGQEPLPVLYLVMCCVYLAVSLFWFCYLRISKHSVYCIHYLMLTVMIIKSLSLLFHGINFYMIGKHGIPEEGWAVMYYITHVIRGALLFITILLIGAGWSFIKHMLAPRERNVFLIVIPLQVLANVATIVIEESETGAERYVLWKEIFIVLDLACCAAVIFPVVWSIRHLQTASQVDGKAAINLRKLRLFRHFYMLIIVYIYVTRIIVYLLSITVPYTRTWVVELFKEGVTVFFFLAVGYMFRPISDNPYLTIANADEEEDGGEDVVMERIQLEDAWSQSGVTDGVSRVASARKNQSSAKPTTTTKGLVNAAYNEPDNVRDDDRYQQV